MIYAHSDILIRRSEYFSTMLTSSFSENLTLPPGERQTHTIIVEEAEFNTIYWLLKYCYANYLVFKQEDDPRAAVEGVEAGWCAKTLNSRENEWDWMTFYKPGHDDVGHDSRSAASGDSVALAAGHRSTTRKSEDQDRAPVTQPNPPSGISSARPPSSKATLSASTAGGSARTGNTNARRSTTNALGVDSTAAGPSTAHARSKPAPVPVSSAGFNAKAHYPASPRVARTNPDPHPHPTAPPLPASALAMYQVAHRYSMRSLAVLALEHIMSTLNPDSCFAVLLASYVWDELHSLVEVWESHETIGIACFLTVPDRTMSSTNGTRFQYQRSLNAAAGKLLPESEWCFV